jgi:hypothetical protein
MIHEGSGTPEGKRSTAVQDAGTSRQLRSARSPYWRRIIGVAGAGRKYLVHGDETFRDRVDEVAGETNPVDVGIHLTQVSSTASNVAGLKRRSSAET